MIWLDSSMGCGSSKDKVINTTTNTSTDSTDNSENNNVTKQSDKIIAHTKGEFNRSLIYIFEFETQ